MKAGTTGANKRMKRLLLVVMLVVLVLAAAGTAWAEGHSCRHWYPDPYYGGYWLWLQCPGENDPHNGGKWSPQGWFSDLPSYEWNSEYLDIREPIYY